MGPPHERVERAVASASSEAAHTKPAALSALTHGSLSAVTQVEPGTQLEAINRALRKWLRDDERVILLGEDLRSPYGGAFKATRGLSDEFPQRVINTPISEAGIVGIGNGLALGGRRPVVEIMQPRRICAAWSASRARLISRRRRVERESIGQLRRFGCSRHSTTW